MEMCGCFKFFAEEERESPSLYLGQRCLRTSSRSPLADFSQPFTTFAELDLFAYRETETVSVPTLCLIDLIMTWLCGWMSVRVHLRALLYLCSRPIVLGCLRSVFYLSVPIVFSFLQPYYVPWTLFDSLFYSYPAPLHGEHD